MNAPTIVPRPLITNWQSLRMEEGRALLNEPPHTCHRSFRAFPSSSCRHSSCQWTRGAPELRPLAMRWGETRRAPAPAARPMAWAHQRSGTKQAGRAGLRETATIGRLTGVQLALIGVDGLATSLSARGPDPPESIRHHVHHVPHVVTVGIGAEEEVARAESGPLGVVPSGRRSTARPPSSRSTPSIGGDPDWRAPRSTSNESATGNRVRGNAYRNIFVTGLYTSAAVEPPCPPRGCLYSSYLYCYRLYARPPRPELIASTASRRGCILR